MGKFLYLINVGRYSTYPTELTLKWHGYLTMRDLWFTIGVIVHGFEGRQLGKGYCVAD